MKKISLSILLILLCISCSDLSEQEIVPPQPAKKTYKIGDVLNYEGISKVWTDDFDGTEIDQTKWGFEKGHVRNEENQYYTVNRPENCRIENGMLVLEGREEETLYEGKEKYTSASLLTRYKHSWQYGRFEIRAKVPSGQGAWPAFWMKGDSQNPPTNAGWPGCGEIDIMEYAGKDPKIMIHNVIYKIDENNNHKSIVKKYEGNVPFSEDFHIYSLEWTKDQLVFAIDNKVTHLVNLDMLDPKYNPFHQKFSMIINLSLGSETKATLGGKLDPSILPIKYYVDYVHIYQ